MKTWDDTLHTSLLSTTRAHQRPINALQSEAGRVVTASQDHTLKVQVTVEFKILYCIQLHFTDM